jgi:hypothetical protein
MNLAPINGMNNDNTNEFIADPSTKLWMKNLVEVKALGMSKVRRGKAIPVVGHAGP